MNRPTLSLAIVALMSASAAAQVGTPGIDPEDAVAPISVVKGPGIKVGESTILRPVVGLETGFVSNVFYTANDPRGAGLMRLLIELGVGSLSSQRLGAVDARDTTTRDAMTGITNMGQFQYGLDARLSYDQYLGGGDNVAEQGGIGGGLLFAGVVNPQRPWSFAVREDFQRLTRATNFESRSNTNRIVNDLTLQLQWAPTGRTLSGVLHYDNKIDFFEAESQEFANRIQHTGGLRVNWLWLPKTRVYADASVGHWTGLGESLKVTSNPLAVITGIQTALTMRTTAAARIGYANGFYASGPSYSSVVFGGELGWRYSPLGRATIGYNFLHNDSINANFYRDHHVRLNIEQMVVPVVFAVSPEIILRHYEGIDQMLIDGPPTRNDLIVSVPVAVRYNFRDWLAATIAYRFTMVDTEYRYMVDGVIDNPSYARHEVLLGIRAAL